MSKELFIPGVYSWRTREGGTIELYYNDSANWGVRLAEFKLQAPNANPEAHAALFAAAPQMYQALGRCILALAANGAPNCEAAKEAKAILEKARGK